MRRPFFALSGRLSFGLLAGALLLLQLAAAAPASAQKSAAQGSTAREGAAQVHFEGCSARTGQSAAIVVPPASARLGGAALAPGDELALFTDEGHCAGHAVWQGNGAVAITAWGNNAMTDTTDGFAYGQLMHLRLWDASRQTEHHEGNSDMLVRLRTSAPYTQQSLHYVPDGIYIVEQLRVKAARAASR